jgi:hypothetical protein
MTDFLKTIGEKYPVLKRYLQRLKRTTKNVWQEYEAAKRYMRNFNLSYDEDSECLRYIRNRLKV